MVLIVERAIINIICVTIVFNKAKYHICDNNEFASYLLRRPVNASYLLRRTFNASYLLRRTANASYLLRCTANA